MRDLFAVVDQDGGAQASPFCVFQLPGPPRGKGRPRSMIMPRKFGKPFVHVYTDKETVEYEKAIAWQAKAGMRGKPLVEGPVAVRIFAMMPIAKSWPKKDRDAALVGTIFPTGKPDGDNICKAVLDACNGIIWRDDTQVVRFLCWKEYAENPGLIVECFHLP